MTGRAPATVLFGAAYYHEYQPYDRLDADIALMDQASVSVVRVGESTWSRWEPEDGRYAFDWIDRVVDRLGAAGIKVILGTPTYAIPPWLWRKHPEMMSRRVGGGQIPYGGRQNVDVAHAAFRFHAERVIRAAVGRFAHHPAVIGFQVDNEAGLELSANDDVLRGFVASLREEYGTVEELDRAWGLTYWSHEIRTWDELWPPDGNTTPGYDLAWRRYQAAITTEYLAWQAGIVRELARDDQFVTHCLVSAHGRPAADRFQIGGVLDVPAENVYYATQDALVLPDTHEDLASPYAPPFTHEAGVWSLFMKADMAYASRQERFLVTETNALSIGLSADNFPAYDGQWRLAAHALVSRGASSICYWHFASCHTGHESYWGGMLGHDLEPGRCFTELAGIGAELRAHGELLASCVPDADVGMLYSYDSAYALGFQPPLRVAGTTTPDPRSYERIFDAWYRGFFDAGAQIGVVPPDGDLGRFAVLVVPALYVASDDELERLVAYARSGGHLVLTMRSGYADGRSTIRPVRAPGPLREAVGASYQEMTNLVTPVALVAGPGAPGSLPAGSAATSWADGLVTEGADVLARYDHPHLGRFAAATRQDFGSGSVTYVGTVPSRTFASFVAELVLERAMVERPWRAAPSSVHASSARTPDGGRLWTVGNWSFGEVAVETPVDAGDVASGEELAAGTAFRLEPFGMRLLRQPPAPGTSALRSTRAPRARSAARRDVARSPGQP